MGNQRGAKIPTPDAARAPLRTPSVTKQLEISAADHIGGAFDKADHRVAQGRCFPWLSNDPLIAIKRDGDFAIAGIVGPAINCLHHEAQASALLRRDARIGGYGTTAPGPPEARQGFDARQCFGVQRDHRGKRRAMWRGIEKQELRSNSGAMKRVHAFGGLATAVCFIVKRRWR